MIPKNKKIALLHPYVDKTWWALKMMLYLSSFLSKTNQVSFFTFYFNKSKNFDYIKDFVIRDYYNKKPWKIFSLFLIAYHIRKYDYIISWNSPMHFAGVFSKIIFLSKAKLIWWNHHYPWYYSWDTNFFIILKRFLEKLILKKIDLVLANSYFLRDSIKDIYWLDSYVLYPTLDKFFNNSPKAKNSDHFTLFTYSRWVKWKNIELIFKLYENLKSEYKNLKIFIWWQWEELQFYKNKYKSVKNIIFLWFLNKEDILFYLNKSNIFLFPSKIDSFWIVALEAMSQSLPVICFEKAWIKEIVDDSKNGFLVKTDDEFIKKTKKLLDNPSLRKKFWESAYKKSKCFDESSFLKSLSEIFSF